MLRGLIILTDPTYEPKPWQNVMLYSAAILFAVNINTIVSSWLPRFETIVLILHVLGFFGILFPWQCPSR